MRALICRCRGCTFPRRANEDYCDECYDGCPLAGTRHEVDDDASRDR